MKKIQYLVLVLAMAFSILTPGVTNAATDVKVFVDGEKIAFDVNPVIKDGRVLVPVRGTFEALNADVAWDQKTKTVSLQKLSKEAALKLNNKEATINGKKEALDVPVQILQNRTLVPLRFLAQAIGADVAWDQKTKTVTIVSLEEALLKKLPNVEVTSMSSTMLINQVMRVMDEEMDMNMKMVIDTVNSPIQMYGTMTMEMEGFEVVTETYLTEQGYYEYNQMLEQWVKYPDEMLADLQNISDMYGSDPLAYLDYLEAIKAVDLGNEYEVQFIISPEKMMEMMNDILGLMSFGVDSAEMEELWNNIKINEFSYTYNFDKKTLYPTSTKGTTNMVMNIEDMEMELIQTFSGEFSNHNKIEKITIPQEIIDSAINFEDIDYEELFAME